MPSLILRPPPTSNPREGARLDLTNPLTRGIYVWETGASNNGTSFNGGSTSPPARAVQPADGRAWKYTRQGANTIWSQYRRFDHAELPATGITYGAIFQRVNRPWDGGVINVSGPGAHTAGIYINQDLFAMFTQGVGGLSQATASLGSTDGSSHVGVGRMNAANSFRDTWLDGVQGGTNSAANGALTTGLTTTVSGEYYQNGAVGAFCYDGTIALVVGWTRYLSDAEVIEWSRRPWQIFRQRRRIWAAAGAGIPVLSAATAASITTTTAKPQVTLTF